MREGFAFIFPSRSFLRYLTFLFFLLEEVTLGLYFIAARSRSAKLRSDWWRRERIPFLSGIPPHKPPRSTPTVPRLGRPWMDRMYRAVFAIQECRRGGASRYGVGVREGRSWVGPVGIGRTPPF